MASIAVTKVFKTFLVSVMSVLIVLPATFVIDRTSTNLGTENTGVDIEAVLCI
jgi:hypothetical protein